MAQQTAMQQLLAQLKDERQNLVMNIEWDRCYQAIEMVIKNTYLQMEMEQMKGMYVEGGFAQMRYIDGKGFITAEQYYNETYNK